MSFQEIKKSSPEIKFPLTQNEIETPQAPKAPHQPEADLQNIFNKSLPDLDESTHFHQGSRSGGSGHALVAWSFVAALIDALILFAVSCFLLFGLSVLVKVQVFSMSEILGENLFQLGIAGGVFLVCTYMIMLRVFLGFTIGEWACGLRLGSLKQRLNKFYSLKVVARMAVICVTGGFILPFLSILVGKDLPGLLVRLPLIQLQNQRSRH